MTRGVCLAGGLKGMEENRMGNGRNLILVFEYLSTMQSLHKSSVATFERHLFITRVHINLNPSKLLHEVYRTPGYNFANISENF